MREAAQELQEAIFKALIADTRLNTDLAEGRIYDRVPEKSAFPYVVLGRSTVSDWSTSTEDGERLVIFVHTWSRDASRAQTLEIHSHIKRILKTLPPALGDHRLINLRFQLADTKREHHEGLYHGLLRFQAVTEPSAQ